MDVAALINNYPRLFHMAEEGSWPSIKKHGLLSTAAALDRYSIQGASRLTLEEGHRAEKVKVGAPADFIVLRDQKPMEPSRLARALTDGTTPAEWYKFLNSKVFMWAEETRLFKLLNARGYGKLTHDVLTIDTAALMAQYENAVWLCPMNSGNTFPMWHARGMDTFKRIANYPTKKRSEAPAKKVVEVVVDYHIPNIADFVVEVRSIQGKNILGNIAL